MSNFIKQLKQIMEGSSSQHVLGIDLGTTNSAIAKIDYERGKENSLMPECIEVEQATVQGEYTSSIVPSVLADHAKNLYIGQGAKRLRTLATHYRLQTNKNLFYEFKNDIGLRKTYPQAPKGFQSAAQVSGKLLDFLFQSASEDGKFFSQTVVTVPASFQVAQRQDTLDSANRYAGLEIGEANLLDEPVAAFLDYLIQNPELNLPAKPQKVLVFDFGGGTCDVAVMTISSQDGNFGLQFNSVSRYHRLGGGDIDRAIVHEVLIPQLLEQAPHLKDDLDYDVKKKVLEPALLGTAESLKVGLCKEIKRLKGFDKYDFADLEKIVKTEASTQKIKLQSKASGIEFSGASLNAKQFETLLEDFLDEDNVHHHEQEYRTTCSIFVPLEDALDRAGLVASDIDKFLLVGGSSLIPQVQEAVESYFGEADLLTYEDARDLQLAIARGAACQALALSAGRTLIEPVCFDGLALRTQDKPLELVPAGSKLPYPSCGGWKTLAGLAVPAAKGNVMLRLELVSADDERTFCTEVCPLEGATPGSPITLKYRFTASQSLELRLIVFENGNDTEYPVDVENPLCHVENPSSVRQEIEEIEQNFREKTISRKKAPDKLDRLADLYEELGQREKALSFLKKAYKIEPERTSKYGHKMAVLYKAMDRTDRAEKWYKKVIDNDPGWGGAYFNLALMLEDYEERREDAIELLKKAYKLDKDPAYLVLHGRILKKMARKDESVKILHQALEEFDEPHQLTDWHISWPYIWLVRELGEIKLKNAVEEERKRRRQNKTKGDDHSAGELPAMHN